MGLGMGGWRRSSIREVIGEGVKGMRFCIFVYQRSWVHIYDAIFAISLSQTQNRKDIVAVPAECPRI